jgi:hypothetical protein
LDLLQEVLKNAGGRPAYALPAAKRLGYTVKQLPEFGNREFVFALLSGERAVRREQAALR